MKDFGIYDNQGRPLLNERHKAVVADVIAKTVADGSALMEQIVNGLATSALSRYPTDESCVTCMHEQGNRCVKYQVEIPATELKTPHPTCHDDGYPF